ncbi:bifunctional phosphopantothenoylcysteine decarboxylase/phosphopantothenate--cysteine ligase CoaBC [Corynebacterium pseudopelargi]|uniref:Coenzyme A biosynthesis bifunctional protein CoaBC n=1 Tax=Corynebacterium pseudopelargi TaxID=2080757 RepID=A0A3G6ITW7_9CORY|nr:bifunctional phosphopantothenoylcysteine decarboxylase/phosphopantothenate--cysteine ligase CoaBC [Corynebacterium pseudopelargi]AZA09195.1 Coenzyme A biosynthesis bifunctional protein CoaBC [Corynebacterium pseudopelargi]
METASKNIVVGVAGGIAAYKACHVIRAFKELGNEVRVVPTEAALEFVGKTTFEALSGNPVSTTVYDAVDQVQHVRIGKEADLIVIAPATADLLARMVQGRADDLLTATLLVATCPVVVAPAMHTEMWEHPATQANVATLRERGVVVLHPAHGRLTGSDSGPGRLLDPEQIVDLALAAAQGSSFESSLAGTKVLISAGGTQEHIDPVRYIGNHSSGRQGFALAEMAAQRGAEVTMVVANSDALPIPAGATMHKVTSAREMQEAIMEHAPNNDAVIMVAAVADVRPAHPADAKLKKGRDEASLQSLALEENPDILRGLVQARERGEVDPKLVIAGFAAETGDAEHSALELAQAKLERKGCDLLMLNEVSDNQVFGQQRNRGVLLSRDGKQREVPDGSKLEVAGVILDELARCLEQVHTAGE